MNLVNAQLMTGQCMTDAQSAHNQWHSSPNHCKEIFILKDFPEQEPQPEPEPQPESAQKITQIGVAATTTGEAEMTINNKGSTKTNYFEKESNS